MTRAEAATDEAARLRAWAARPWPSGMGALLAQAAADAPDLPACVFFEAGEVLTRRALHRRSARLAHGLRAAGVRAGDAVGVMLPNRQEYPVTWLALVRLGAVMVPLNPRYTAHEVAWVLRDAGCTHLVVDEAHLPVVDALPDRPAALDNAHVIVRGNPGALPGANSWTALHDAGSEALEDVAGVLAGIQYTSGTTGFPKGCLLPGDYWTMMGEATAAWLQPAGIRRMLVQNPFHYMNCQWLLASALRMGATLLVAPGPSATRFLPWVKEHGAEWCVMPELVLKQPARNDDRSTALRVACLAAVSAGGQREVARRFRVPACEIYGMTEIGGATATPVGCGRLDMDGSIGVPMLHRALSVRDEAGAPVPPGEVGELWVRGPAMLRGYHGRSDADAEAFRPEAAGTWFRTGDLARIEPDGFYTIVGRLKDMVRRSGENVAAREVEAVLMGASDVVEAAVVAVPDGDRGEEVKAVVALQSGLQPTQAVLDRLRAHCAVQLAPFKVPRFWAFVPELPRTPSNKVEKKLLRQMEDPRAGAWDASEGVWR